VGLCQPYQPTEKLCANYMRNKLLSLILLLFAGQSLLAQTLDTTIYRHLVTANKDEFTIYASSKGYSTSIDTAAEVLFAKTKGCIFAKPLGTKNNNQFYDLVLIVSTQDKANNKLIIKKAAEGPKKGTWTDDQYLYYEWDTQNPVSNAMWYKVLVYKKKS
jgi:hypothetical protein